MKIRHCQNIPTHKKREKVLSNIYNHIYMYIYTHIYTHIHAHTYIFICIGKNMENIFFIDKNFYSNENISKYYMRSVQIWQIAEVFSKKCKIVEFFPQSQQIILAGIAILLNWPIFLDILTRIAQAISA